MVNPLETEKSGLFSSILDWISTPGFAVRNLLRGDLQGAARNGLDGAGDLLDAILPGDWIPHVSRPQDKPQTSDLLGGMEEGWGKFAVNLVGDTLTDPLTYVPGAVVAKGLGSIGAGIGAVVKKTDKLLPGTEKALQHAKLKAKSTFGYLEPKSAEAAAALDEADAAQSMYGKASLKGAETALKGLDEESAKQLSQVIGNYAKEIPQGPAVASGIDNTMDPIYRELKAGSEVPNVSPLDDALTVGEGNVLGSAPERATKPMIKLEDQLAQWHDRIDALGVAPEQSAKLKEYAGRYLTFSHNNFLEKTKDLGALKAGIGDDVTTMIPQDYAHRMFSGLDDADSIALKGGNPNSLKGRTLKENEQFRDFMNENRGKGIEVEEDLVKSTMHLAGQEGRIAQRATLAKTLLGDEFTALNDANIGGKIADKIKAMEGIDPEGAYLVRQAWEGMPERGLLTKALHAANTIFKPAAVAGIGIPRVGGITKNIISFPMQLAAEGEGKQALRQLGRTPATLAEAARKTVQGYGGDLPATAAGKEIDIADAALAAGGGRAKNVLESLENAGHPDIADALKYGVLDGFVSGEGITNALRNSSGMQKIAGKLGASEKTKERVGKALEAPMQGFQGAEQSARFANFKEMRADLIAKGVPRDEASKQAAKRITGALYDYGIKTAENRALRDVIPFGAYQTNAVRQSAKALTKNPWAAVATAEVLGPGPGNDDPLYPYMEGRTNIPLGMDDKGNQNYLTNLGIPLESLNMLPNPSANLLDFGRDLERDIIGSSQPLLKSAFGVVSGEDPFFESPYGTYSKVGGVDMGDPGRAFNMAAGTGLLQPVTSQIGQFQKFFDDKGTALSDTADFLTGANSVSVDEDRALMQQTQEWLKRNPDVQQATTFYQQTKDPRAQEMIHAMNEAKKRIKEKRQMSVAQ